MNGGGVRIGASARSRFSPRGGGRVAGPAAWLLAAVALSVPLGSSLQAAGEPNLERVELSAPILPKVLILYAAEGEKFPATAEAQVTLAHQAALTYDVLLRECPAKYPQIVVPGPGDPPTTPAQNAANFEAIATCSYEQYTAKPYWVPALVDKVDICGTELGAGWHLPTEDEVNGLDDSDRRALANGLATPNAGTFFGNFYFGLTVWARGKDGSLRVADLSPGATAKISDLPVPATSKTHYEGGLALRCLRRTPVGSTTGGGGGATGAGGAGGSSGAGGKAGAAGAGGAAGTGGVHPTTV